MKQKLLLIFLPLLMLACKTLLPEPVKRPEPVSAPTRAQVQKTSTPRPASAAGEAEPSDPNKPDFTLVRLEPGDGKLSALLAAEVQKAEALGQIPVVEFDAPW